MFNEPDDRNGKPWSLGQRVAFWVMAGAIGGFIALNLGNSLATGYFNW